ncbi:MAG TPA: signal peptidase I [Burkholderiaceae bacterium]|nr:signal peptidase I [Burkholderiaceae bacterium]
MSGVTAAVLLALGVYIAMMISGQVATDFALFLFICTVVSGVYFILERAVFAPRRRAAAAQAVAEFDRRNAGGLAAGAEALGRERVQLVERIEMRPWWVEYTAGFFPVIVAVFVLRSFLFEPFRIPSGSMIPTLQVGDLILVNKWQYGIRLPVLNRKIIAIGDPQRGDVMVFRYPHQPTQDYIKRVVGLPGDRVEYNDRQLKINGEVVPTQPLGDYIDEARVQSYRQYVERLGNIEHRIIYSTGPSAPIVPAMQHTNPEACHYVGGGVSCTVPPDSYFMMGDNRDNSEDSRYWGFVPDRNIVGRAFFIWMNFGNIGRIGNFK